MYLHHLYLHFGFVLTELFKSLTGPLTLGRQWKVSIFCWVLLSENKWFQEGGKCFGASKGKGRAMSQWFGSYRYVSNMQQMIDRKCSSGLRNWSYSCLGLVGLGGSQWAKSGTRVSHPLWVGRKNWNTPSSLCKSLLSLKSPMVGLCWILWQFASQAKWRP